MGIDRAGSYNTVCVHTGVYGCGGEWAANIRQNIMLRGFDAVVDCNNKGGAFKIGAESLVVVQVVISGFSVYNAVGNANNNGYAGGIDAYNTWNISVLSSSFSNCTGREAGAIAMYTTGITHNLRNFDDLTISDCSGGTRDINSRLGGTAGSISLSYYSATISGSNNNNIHSMSHIQISNSKGGWGSVHGGVAGSISISYYSLSGSNDNNEHSLSYIQVNRSEGGTDPNNGGAAGSISIAYHSDVGSGNANNVHQMTQTQISDSTGGRNTLNGGCSGSISVSYSALQGGNTNNTHQISQVQISNSTGGAATYGGGAAGSISISYYAAGNNDGNTHSMIDLQIFDSQGGVEAKRGGAAGSISISLYASQGQNNQNANIMSNVTIQNSVGGINTVGGASAGGVSFSYFSEILQHNNSHILSNVSFLKCRGGERTAGAGALSVYLQGPSFFMQTLIDDSVFTMNTGATAKSVLAPSVGAAGALLIFAKESADNVSANNFARITRSVFDSNSLDPTCTDSLCLAGALTTMVETIIESSRFYNNTCPRNSGAVFAEAELTLTDSTFADNTASQVFFGTANVGQLSATNTSLQMMNDQGGLVFNNLSFDRLLMTCPTGTEVDIDTPGQYTCKDCPIGYFSLAAGQWLDGVRPILCEECPVQDPSMAACRGNSVVTEPGYFGYFATTEPSRRTGSSSSVAISECPNPDACIYQSVINYICDASVSACNSDITGKCADGYHGLRCAQCADDWFSSKLNALVCKSCPHAVVSALLAISIGVALYLIGIMLGKDITADEEHESEEYSMDQPPGSPNSPTVQHREALKNRHLKQTRKLCVMNSSFKQLMVHATILSTIPGTNWEWKSEVDSMFGESTQSAGSVGDFDLYCAFGASFEESVYFSLTYPTVVSCMVFGIAVLLWKLSAWTGSFKCLSTTLWLFAIVGAYTFGPQVISDLFVSFPCFDGTDDDGANKEMMVHDASTVCYGHESLMVLSIAGILTYGTGIAYILGYALWNRKDVIQSPSSHEASVVKRTYKSFGFLFYDYKPNYFFWETIVYGRKTMILITCIYLPPVNTMLTRTLAIGLVMLLSLVLTSRFRPYLLEETNALDIATQSVSMVSIMMASYIHGTDTHSEGKTKRQAVTVIFVSSNLLLILLHMRHVAPPLLAKMRDAFAKVMACVCGKGSTEASAELPLHNIWGDGAELEAVTSVRIIDVIDRNFKNDLTDDLPTPSEEISAIFDSTTGALSA